MTLPDVSDQLDRLRAALGAQYSIDRELGGGGMSNVYLARDESLGRRVVIKVLQPNLAAGLSADRFRREVMVAAALQHPNIVPVLSAGEVPAGGAMALPYFIMPYVEGESLRDRLVRGPLSVRETVNVARDIGRALVFAHGRGIVHRDIKPGNILLSSGAAVVTDFGVAKALTLSRHGAASGPQAAPPQLHTSLTAIGTSLGTPAYMAPEQAAADPNVDHRADLYALGVVFYQMLTGELPAPDQLQPPSRRVRLDVRLDEIVLRALETDPARRYAAASELKTQVETVAQDPSSVVAGAATPVPASSRWDLDYRSRRTLFGWPLLHVATGVDPATGRRRVARGVFAVGDRARGVVAFGGVATGVFAFGALALGVFSFGGLALGLRQLVVGGRSGEVGA